MKYYRSMSSLKSIKTAVYNPKKRQCHMSSRYYILKTVEGRTGETHYITLIIVKIN